MTIQEAYNFFTSLITETNKKTETKVYENFVDILFKLKSKKFSIDEMDYIETKLESFNLKSNPKNRKKYFKKALTEFEKYLKDTFYLTSKGYYTEYGIGLGSTFGVVLGVFIGERFDEGSSGIALGIGIGLLIGGFVGHHMDTKAKAAGKIL